MSGEKHGGVVQPGSARRTCLIDIGNNNLIVKIANDT